jgi:hypothetical protein
MIVYEWDMYSLAILMINCSFLLESLLDLGSNSFCSLFLGEFELSKPFASL